MSNSLNILVALAATVGIVALFKVAVLRSTGPRALSEFAATSVSLLFVALFVGVGAWLTVAILPFFDDALIGCMVAAVAFVVTIFVTSIAATRLGLGTPTRMLAGR